MTYDELDAEVTRVAELVVAAEEELQLRGGAAASGSSRGGAASEEEQVQVLARVRAGAALAPAGSEPRAVQQEALLQVLEAFQKGLCGGIVVTVEKYCSIEK